MKVLSVAVVCVSVVLLASLQQSEAKLGLMVAPFVWAGNLAKNAAQSLLAYKLSLATKALAMITGNRSFKAQISYDSRLGRYEEPEDYDEDHDMDWSARIVAVTAAPNPVHVENEVKVDWLPGVTKRVPVHVTKKPVPIHVPEKPVTFHVPKVVMPSVIRLPTLPPLPHVVNKVVVPKIIVPPIVVPDLIKTKDALLKKLGRKSTQLLSGGPKYASGYIKGGFRVGHGAAGSHSADAQLSSGQQQAFAPVTPAVQLGSGEQQAFAPVTPAVQLGSGEQQNLASVNRSDPGSGAQQTSPVTRTVNPGSGEQQTLAPVTPAVGPRTPLLEDTNATAQNASTDTPVHRPVRSADSTMMGRYFKFIQDNDEGRCVALMVCSMAADPQEFGWYGRKVVQFFEGVQTSSSSPVAPYKKAAMVGRSGDSCKSRYSACQVNPKYLAQLGEFHSS